MPSFPCFVGALSADHKLLMSPLDRWETEVHSWHVTRPGPRLWERWPSIQIQCFCTLELRGAHSPTELGLLSALVP